MRVIGGTLRGRRLAAPDGSATRPMLDRVREALFSTLAPWLPEARVLDLFAGSGSLGIEALSRGAAHARFVERSPHAFEPLRKNLEALELAARSELVRGDALAASSWGAGPFDVVFLDSPYPLLDEAGSRAAVLGALHALVREHLAPEGVLVFHAPVRGVLPSEFGAELVVRERDYGTNALWYVQRG
jgi:16S rRNA (guanine966-N2)-methyltransferase